MALMCITCQISNIASAVVRTLSNSNTMGCPSVCGALASGLSYVQVDKHGITILYHLHQCRPCTLQNFLGAQVGKGSINWFSSFGKFLAYTMHHHRETIKSIKLTEKEMPDESKKW